MLRNMKEYSEEDYLMISGIQHYEFCRRQWALIHIEDMWEDNLRTVEGNIMHERAHDGPVKESRGSKLISREMRVFSRTLGITGICDVVEFIQCEEDANAITLQERDGKYIVIPVEYKKGESKKSDADRLQLIAQIMCLEEMMSTNIYYGYLYYGKTKQREKVYADQNARDSVKRALNEMHQLYERRYTPKVKWSKACNACSLKDLCIPKLFKEKNVHDYILNKVKDES